MKKSKRRYTAGKNVRDVTILPNCILKQIGKTDARKGTDVALAHINRYLEKCAAIENDECLASEEFLKRARFAGAANLDIIENTAKETPNMPGAIEAVHTWEVLENRKRANSKANAAAAVREAKSCLYKIHEEIVNGMSILEQRIIKIRKKAATKITAYIEGVRAGGLSSFNPDISFSDAVVEAYYKKHTRDKDIAAVAAVSSHEEERI